MDHSMCSLNTKSFYHMRKQHSHLDVQSQHRNTRTRFKVNKKEKRTLFDNFVLVYLILSFNFKPVSRLVLVFLLLTLKM